MSAFTAGAKSVEGRAGRPVASAQMQLVLWLYAISVGVGSAREIERPTRTDAAFEWIVADQKVSHDTLSVRSVSSRTRTSSTIMGGPRYSCVARRR